MLHSVFGRGLLRQPVYGLARHPLLSSSNNQIANPLGSVSRQLVRLSGCRFTSSSTPNTLSSTSTTTTVTTSPVANATQIVVQKTRRDLNTTIVNKESVARDQLANERTLLAWSRTGLAFMGAGLAYFMATTENQQRLDTLHENYILTATGLLLGNGVTMLGFSVYRYFTVMRALQRGSFVLNQGGVMLVISSTGLCTATALYCMFLDRFGERSLVTSATTSAGKDAIVTSKYWVDRLPGFPFFFSSSSPTSSSASSKSK